MRPISHIILVFLLLVPAASFANRLYRAYSIPYGRSDRVILEFDHRAEYKMTNRGGDMIEMTFDDAELSPDFRLGEPPEQLAIVKSISPHNNGAGQLVLTIELQRQAEPTGITLTTNPWRYAVDLAPKVMNGEQAKPPYIPGDRPFQTKYSHADSLDKRPVPGVRMSRTTFIFMMLLLFIAGAMSVIGTGYGLQLLRKRLRIAPDPQRPTDSPREMLHLELERDLARLKRTVEWESTEMSEGARQLHDEREQLILKMLKEGRQLDAIAEALSMTPDQIRRILDRHP